MSNNSVDSSAYGTNPKYGTLQDVYRIGNMIECCIVIAGLIYSLYLGRTTTNSMTATDEFFCTLFGVVFMMIGMIFPSRMTKSRISSVNNCSVEVTAEVVSNVVEKESGERGTTSTTYRPIYGYTYNGQLYHSAAQVSGPFKPKIGKSLKLLIDPNDPSQYFDPSGDMTLIIFYYIIGALCSGMGLLVLILAHSV